MLFGKKSGGYEFIIAGLGNPGAKYEMTRHNAGFLAVELLARENDFDIKRLKFHALTADFSGFGKKCLIMKPQTFMNNSGEAVGEAARFYKIPPQNIIVVSDDISLDVGKIRIRRDGSHGGQNGMKNIIELCGTNKFPRVKIGIGQKPNPEWDLADWVLSKFTCEELKNINSAVKSVMRAVTLIIQGDIEKAMNNYN